MNILIVTDPSVSLRQPYGSGTERFVVNVANTLVRKGYSVDVIAKDTDEANLFQVITFPESMFSMKDDSYRPSSESEGQRYYQSLQYARMGVGQYDIIHYASHIPEIYEVATLKDKPIIVTIHTPAEKEPTVMYDLFLKQMPSQVVVNSRQMQHSWRKVLGIAPKIITEEPSKEEHGRSTWSNDTMADKYLALYNDMLMQETY